MKVNEIFQTVQGEGPGSGRHALFIRFSGCNLNCDYCDSKYALHTYLEATIEEIINCVHRSGCQYIVLTGGEPMMQTDINVLISNLVLCGYDIDVETNGTFMPTLTAGVRYIVSPKDKDQTIIDKWLNYSANFVFKFVVDGINVEDYMKICQERKISGAYFMPLTNIHSNYGQQMMTMTNIGRQVIEAMVRYHIDGYLCTRLQNLYRVR